jgi:hypothetical protein
MATALFWILLSTYFASKISRLFVSSKLTILIMLLAFSSQGLLISYGSNLHHAPTMTLTLCLTYLLLKRDQILSSKESKINLLFIGITYAAITNNYASIAVFLFIPIVITLLFEYRKMRDNEQSIDHGTSLRLNSVITHNIPILTTTFALTSALFEIVHQVLSDASAPILIQQLRLGSSLLTEKNPWGGGGFTSYWTAGLWVFSSMPWVLLSIVILAVNSLIHRGGSLNARVQIISIGILVSMALTTLGYSSPTWHTFTACILFPIYFLSVTVAIKFLMNFCTESNLVILLTIFLLGKILFQFFWINTTLNSLDSFKSLIRFSLLASGVLVICLCSLVIKKTFFKMHFIFAKITLGVALFSIVFASLPHSLLQLYTGEKPAFTSYNQANSFYVNLSHMRDSILSETKSGSVSYRVWLTPDDEIALASTQLYAYSLISFTPGIADCNQVNWATPGNNTKIMSFSSNNFTRQGFNRYLEKCGAKVSQFRLINKGNSPDSSKAPYAVAIILPK